VYSKTPATSVVGPVVGIGVGRKSRGPLCPCCWCDWGPLGRSFRGGWRWRRECRECLTGPAAANPSSSPPKQNY